MEYFESEIFNKSSIKDVKIISDNHFNHNKIIEYCDRPFDNITEMNKVMTYIWNVSVDENDIVLHLGDFSFGSKGSVKRIRDKLNGEIYMIKGNHDKHGVQWYKDIGIYMIRDSFTVGGEYIFSHRPIKSVPKSMINIHGHVHNNVPLFRESEFGNKHVNVSVENLGYKPILFSKLIKLWDNREYFFEKTT